MPEKKLAIKVIIADRAYHMHVSENEEAITRQTAHLINEKIKQLETQYGAKDKQDYLAMAALVLCIELSQLNQQQIYNQQEKGQLQAKFKTLDAILTDFLNT